MIDPEDLQLLLTGAMRHALGGTSEYHYLPNSGPDTPNEYYSAWAIHWMLDNLHEFSRTSLKSLLEDEDLWSYESLELLDAIKNHIDGEVRKS